MRAVHHTLWLHTAAAHGPSIGARLAAAAAAPRRDRARRGHIPLSWPNDPGSERVPQPPPSPPKAASSQMHPTETVTPSSSRLIPPECCTRHGSAGEEDELTGCGPRAQHRAQSTEPSVTAQCNKRQWGGQANRSTTAAARSVDEPTDERVGAVATARAATYSASRPSRACVSSSRLPVLSSSPPQCSPSTARLPNRRGARQRREHTGRVVCVWLHANNAASAPAARR